MEPLGLPRIGPGWLREAEAAMFAEEEGLEEDPEDDLEEISLRIKYGPYRRGYGPYIPCWGHSGTWYEYIRMWSQYLSKGGSSIAAPM